MSFASFLIEKFGEHNPKEIDELILDELIPDLGTLNEDQKKVLEQYSNLVRLSMSHLGIQSLKNFPSLPNLYVLEVNHNLLTGEDFNEIPKLYPNLHKQKVTGNKITSIDVFKAIEKSSIQKIEVLDNPFMTGSKVEEELFDLLENVKIINRHNRGGEEIDTTDYEEEDEEEEDFEEDESLEDDDVNENGEEEFEAEEDEEDEDEEESESQPNKKSKRH